MKQFDNTTWAHYSYTISLEYTIEMAGIYAYESSVPRYIVRDKAGIIISEAYSLTQAKKDISLDLYVRKQVKRDLTWVKQQKRIEQW